MVSNATVNHKDNNENSSFPSNLNKFDDKLHFNTSIFEKIIQNVTEPWLFYELMQLLSHRIDFHEIKGPFADYLNNNKDFQIIDNNKTTHEGDESKFLAYMENKNNKKENTHNKLFNRSYDNSDQQYCCCNIDKDDKSSNQITIKQFTNSYTNFSENKLDGQQGLKWPSFSKSSQFSSKLFKFDGKDATDTKNDEENQLKETEIDNNTRISDHNVYDISNTSNINNKEILKSDLMTEHNNL
jgi:hypothetical protein